MLLCLPLIGVLAFERTLAPKTQSIHLKLRGKGITADGSDTGRGFVVERGSQAVAVPVRSMQPYVDALRKALLAQGIFTVKGDKWELTRDYKFESPSTAASALLGKSANGREEWKSESGRTLKDIQDAPRASASEDE